MRRHLVCLHFVVFIGLNSVACMDEADYENDEISLSEQAVARHDLIEPVAMNVTIIRASHSNLMTDYLDPTWGWLFGPKTIYDSDDVRQMMFGDPTPHPLVGFSVADYWEEVSSGGLELTGSVTEVFDIGREVGYRGPFYPFPGWNIPCTDPAVSFYEPTECLIQGESGATPTPVELPIWLCDAARAVDAYMGCQPGEGCNWLGDEPETHFGIFFNPTEPQNSCLGGIGRGAWGRDIFGKPMFWAIDFENYNNSPIPADENRWAEIQTFVLAHEIGHNFGFTHSDGMYCEDTDWLDSGDALFTPVIYSNRADRWCTSYDYRYYYNPLPFSDQWILINNPLDLMSGNGWHVVTLPGQTQFHVGHTNMWLKMNNLFSTWVDEQTIGHLVPTRRKSKWTIRLAPAATSQTDPALLRGDAYAAAILEINEDERFLLEFHRPSSENPWDFVRFDADDPLVNGLAIYRIVAPHERYNSLDGIPFDQAHLLNCNPPQISYSSSEWLDVLDQLFDFTHATCGVGQKGVFYIYGEDGSETKVEISVEDLDTTPGASWMEVEVEVETELDDEGRPNRHHRERARHNRRPDHPVTPGPRWSRDGAWQTP